MKMNRIIALIGVLLMLPLLCVPAFATENTGTLVLRCDTQYEGKHVVFTGDEYALTKIADVWVENEIGSNRMHYATLPEYQAYTCDWGKLNASQLREKAKELAVVVTQHRQYDAVATVDQEGKATFTGVAPALYLVSRTKTVNGHEQYAYEPFLASLPMELDGDIYFTVIGSPKYGWTATEVDPPDTGDWNRPFAAFILSGSTLIFLGVRQYYKNKRQNSF